MQPIVKIFLKLGIDESLQVFTGHPQNRIFPVFNFAQSVAKIHLAAVFAPQPTVVVGFQSGFTDLIIDEKFGVIVQILLVGKTDETENVGKSLRVAVNPVERRLNANAGKIIGFQSGNFSVVRFVLKEKLFAEVPVLFFKLRFELFPVQAESPGHDFQNLRPLFHIVRELVGNEKNVQSGLVFDERHPETVENNAPRRRLLKRVAHIGQRPRPIKRMVRKSQIQKLKNRRRGKKKNNRPKTPENPRI